MSVLLEETMQKGGFVRHARHRAVETKVKAGIDKMNSLFCIEYKNRRIP